MYKLKDEDHTIEIDLDTYNTLLSDQKMLHALCAAGVDNWDGYDFAMEILNQND